MRFNFVGELKMNGLDSQNPYLRVGKTKNGSEYKSLGLSVIAKNNNRAYCTMFGMPRDVIFCYYLNGDRAEVEWDERNDSNILKDIGNASKFVVSHDGNRYEKLAELDIINHIEENIDAFKGKRFCVTGDLRKNIYNGKITDRFEIRRITEVTNDDVKNKLSVNGVIYFTKDSIDTADWKSEKKLIINGWVKQYISKDEGTKYVPHQIVFNCSKIDFENKRQVGIVRLRLKQIGLDYEDGRIINNLKPKKVYYNHVFLVYNNGAEEIEFNESMLTTNQKEMIELGLKTLDDFKPTQNIYGHSVVVYNLVDFLAKDDFADGCVVSDETLSEFEDNIYVIHEDESIDDVIKDEVPFKEDDDDDDDLFS